MWKFISDTGRQLFGITQRMNKFEAEQSQMRDDLRRLERLVEFLLITEEKNKDLRDRDKDIWERDKRILMLELQQELHKFERRLPPAN